MNSPLLYGCSVAPLCCNCVQYGCCLAAIIWLLCAIVQLPYYGAMWLLCGCHTKAYQGGWMLGDRGTGGPRKVRFSPNGRVPNMGLDSPSYAILLRIQVLLALKKAFGELLQKGFYAFGQISTKGVMLWRDFNKRLHSFRETSAACHTYYGCIRVIAILWLQQLEELQWKQFDVQREI